MSVYFIKVGPYIKVGYSENPQRRCLNLWHSGTRYTRPWDLSLSEVPELLLAVEGDKPTERQCHLALRDYAAGLEWFIDEPGVREFMSHVAKYAARDLRPFPEITRPEGPFVPVPFEWAIPERVREVEQMIQRRRSA